MTHDASPLPSLPGGDGPPIIDAQAGVERMMGNRDIYLRALARFRNDYRHAAAAIRAALDAGDADLARRLVHTLKGAAGMIEAGALYTAALALEAALRSGGQDVALSFERTAAALDGMLHELDRMPALAEAPAAAAVPAGPGVRPRLRAMLDIGDGAAVELVAAARAELSAELGEREYEGLRAAVLMFDYERALELLDRPGGAGII